MENNPNPEIIYVYVYLPQPSKPRSDSLIKAQQKYRQNNREKLKLDSKIYYKNNKEKRLEYFKERHTKKKLDKLEQTIESI